MIINKAHWTTEGDNLKFSMPISKVDAERRTVSGFATLDNIDKQGDIVTKEASLVAFEKFRGNLREMHQPLAVGKVVSFKEDRYFDPESKKFYNGIYVSAYVSKGAQDTWEKVLDGTLTSFSIGGNITKFDDAFDKGADKQIRVIKEYDLFELSLVDNPANQFANVLSVQKVGDKTVVGGFLAKADINNVFWCNSDDIVQLSDVESTDCPSCSKTMTNIGFIEKNDDSTETIKFLVDSAKGIRTIKMTKEDNTMTEDTNIAVEDVKVETTTLDAPAESVVADAPETQLESDEKTLEGSIAESDQTVGETPKNDSDATEVEEIVDVKKSEEAVAQAVTEIKESLANAFGDLTATVKSISDQVTELTKSLSDTNADMTNVKNQVASVVNQVEGAFNEFGKRVDQVEADTAFRKSGDLGEIVQESDINQVQKSLWGGRFLKTADLFN